MQLALDVREDLINQKCITYVQQKKYKRIRFLAYRDPSLNDETNCDKIYAKEHPDEDPEINYEDEFIKHRTYMAPIFTEKMYKSRNDENKRFHEFYATLDKDQYEANELRQKYEKFFNTKITPSGFGKLKSLKNYFDTLKNIRKVGNSSKTTTYYHKKHQ